mmetsp:Transcript_5385/g.20216  ORF Transcript_5385/g.20216 Transcript_5385/m.20216 type:complete len:305 (-) Transcript_5385:622-1536(-)
MTRRKRDETRKSRVHTTDSKRPSCVREKPGSNARTASAVPRTRGARKIGAHDAFLTWLAPAELSPKSEIGQDSYPIARPFIPSRVSHHGCRPIHSRGRPQDRQRARELRPPPGGEPREPGGFLRPAARAVRRRHEAGAHNHGAEKRRHAENRGELQAALLGTGRERVQGKQVPQGDSAVHVPRRRLHQRQRHGRPVDLRPDVRGRELFVAAPGPRDFVHGQRRTEHEREPVFLVHRRHAVPQRQAHRVRPGTGRVQRHQSRGGVRQPGRGNERGRDHRRLRRDFRGEQGRRENDPRCRRRKSVV